MYKYIYKITNKINNKVYIGQTKDISRRFREHRQCGYNQVKNKILYNAIRKYGVENFFFEVLEYTTNYNEREQYWINYYNSTNSNCGYNIDNNGIPKPHKIEVTEIEYQGIYMDLKEGRLSFQEIANKYHFVSPQSIRDINKGKIYYHKELNYPIRPDRNTLAQEKAKAIRDLLLDDEYTISDIANKFNMDESYIYQINSGTRCKIEGQDYPIRKTQSAIRKQRHCLSKEEIEFLKSDIMNTSLTFKRLSEKYNVDTKVCQHINQGTTYYDANLHYPLRETQKSIAVSQDIIDKIYYDLINSPLQQKQIAKKYNVSESTVNSVNQGRYHYKEKYTYPIRKRQQPVETMEGQSSSTPTIDTQGETGIAANNN